MVITDKQRWVEIAAVALTAAGKLGLMTYSGNRTIFIPVVILFWVGYVRYRAKGQGGILAYWGFRFDSLPSEFSHDWDILFRTGVYLGISP